MKRLIWGIVLVGLGVATEGGASHNPNGPTPSHVLALVLVGVGGWLSYSGWQHRELVRRTAALGFQLWRQHGRVPGEQIAAGLGLSEYRARRILIDLKRQGKFPVEAEIG